MQTRLWMRVQVAARLAALAARPSVVGAHRRRAALAVAWLPVALGACKRVGRGVLLRVAHPVLVAAVVLQCQAWTRVSWAFAQGKAHTRWPRRPAPT